MKEKQVPKDDQVVVGVDLPEGYTFWSKSGSTKLSDWPSAVEMAFNFDFTGVPLERVFELAVGALVIDRRPALKKEGFEFCRDNPVVDCKVSELKTKGPAQPRNAKTVVSDIKTLKKQMSPEAYKAFLKEAMDALELESEAKE